MFGGVDIEELSLGPVELGGETWVPMYNEQGNQAFLTYVPYSVIEQQLDFDNDDDESPYRIK